MHSQNPIYTHLLVTSDTLWNRSGSKPIHHAVTGSLSLNNSSALVAFIGLDFWGIAAILLNGCILAILYKLSVVLLVFLKVWVSLPQCKGVSHNSYVESTLKKIMQNSCGVENFSMHNCIFATINCMVKYSI